MTTILNRVMTVYRASSAEATKRLYDELLERGPVGELAVNLLRACKKSERAKVYRGSQYRSASYDGKQWAMNEVCRVLLAHPELSVTWGWGADENQDFHKQVLYVDLPTGQVSFHTEQRGAGPDYPGKWDEMPGHSAQRACAYAAQVLAGQATVAA